MAKNTQPVLKRCRTLGVSPAAMGYSKQSNRNPGGKRRTSNVVRFIFVPPSTTPWSR